MSNDLFVCIFVVFCFVYFPVIRGWLKKESESQRRGRSEIFKKKKKKKKEKKEIKKKKKTPNKVKK